MDETPIELGDRRAEKANRQAPDSEHESGDAPAESDLLQRGLSRAAREVELRANEAHLSARQLLTVDSDPDEILQIDRLLAAYDRAAAALERYRASVDRRRAKDQLRWAYRDELTGALQRDMGRQMLIAEVARAHRSDSPLSLMFVDVDGLKRINDQRGHLAADEVLRSVGEALKRHLRSYDVVVRFGGDELVVGLPGATMSEARARFAEMLLSLDTINADASITAGISQLREDDSLDDLLGRADADMYARRAASRPVPRQPSD